MRGSNTNGSFQIIKKAKGEGSHALWTIIHCQNNPTINSHGRKIKTHRSCTVGQSVSQSIHPMIRSINQSVSKSIDQPINESVKQCIRQEIRPVNQSINQSNIKSNKEIKKQTKNNKEFKENDYNTRHTQTSSVIYPLPGFYKLYNKYAHTERNRKQTKARTQECARVNESVTKTKKQTDKTLRTRTGQSKA